MCAKPEPTEYLPQIADLATEFRDYQQPTLVDDMAWAGTTLYRGVLENA